MMLLYDSFFMIEKLLFVSLSQMHWSSLCFDATTTMSETKNDEKKTTKN
jgi:hypothetical protein